MEVQSVFSRAIKAEAVPLERLASNTQISEEEKIAGVSRHFEAIMIRQFLTEAYKPVLDPKDGDNNSVNDIYKDMMIESLADSISKSGNFGLAQSFQSQMVHPKKKASESGQPGEDKALIE